ncbi:hypothetical protein [Nocardia sp. CA-135398]
MHDFGHVFVKELQRGYRYPELESVRGIESRVRRDIVMPQLNGNY